MQKGMSLRSRRELELMTKKFRQIWKHLIGVLKTLDWSRC